MYQLIVAGSRQHIIDEDVLTYQIRNFLTDTVVGPKELDAWMLENLEIFSGGAKGIDSCAVDWSYTHLKRDATVFEADWARWGNQAGPRRNGEMARKATAALIFHHREPSPGSSNMGAWMDLLNKPKRVLALDKGKIITL